MSTPRSCLAAAGAAVLLLAGCTSHPGEGIVERIRAAESPIVREIQLLPSAFSQSTFDQVVVYLVDDASDDQALDLWCTVVLPAGISELPARAVRLYKGGELGPAGGRYGAKLILTDPVVCPPRG